MPYRYASRVYGERMLSEANISKAVLYLAMTNTDAAPFLYVQQLWLFVQSGCRRKGKQASIPGIAYSLDDNNRIAQNDVHNADALCLYIDLTKYIDAPVEALCNLGALLFVWVIYKAIADASSAGQQLAHLSRYCINTYGLTSYTSLCKDSDVRKLKKQNPALTIHIELAVARTIYVRAMTRILPPCFVAQLRLQRTQIAFYSGPTKF